MNFELLLVFGKNTRLLRFAANDEAYMHFSQGGVFTETEPINTCPCNLLDPKSI